MREIDTVLFDLDGTLTNPEEGITRSIQFAIMRAGRQPIDRTDLVKYIGPSLRETFAILLGSESSVENIQQMVTDYRERYSETGWRENHIYPGIADMLNLLKSHGYRLYVATSKPHIYANRILEHFGLDQYFTGVYGSELNGVMDDKSELIANIVQKEELKVQDTIMAGDRKYDIAAALNNKILPVGVTYGFGSSEELSAAGAKYLVNTPSELGKIILNFRETNNILDSSNPCNSL